MGEGLRSLVFRLPEEKLDALRQLAAATRVEQSELLREAIQDLLAKYGEAEPYPLPPLWQRLVEELRR